MFFRDLGKDLKLYTIFFGVSVVFDQIINYLAEHGQNSWLFGNIFHLIEYIMIIYVFSHWQKNIRLQRVLHWSIPVYTIFWIWVKIFGIEYMDKFPHYTRSVAAIIIAILAIYTLIKLEENESYIYKHYQFWICVGALLYFSGNIVLFSLSDIVLVNNLFFIHSILNISANFLYAGGFWCCHFQLKNGIVFY